MYGMSTTGPIMVKKSKPVDHWVLYQTGEASWYGKPEHGGPTASGKPFNMYALTCAHRTLPLGTTVRVKYKDKVVDLLVNDRGPYSHGRIVDLSKAGFDKLASTEPRGPGHIIVKIYVWR